MSGPQKGLAPRQMKGVFSLLSGAARFLVYFLKFSGVTNEYHLTCVRSAALSIDGISCKQADVIQHWSVRKLRLKPLRRHSSMLNHLLGARGN